MAGLAGFAAGMLGQGAGLGVLENRRRAVALTRLREAAEDGAFDLALLADKGNYRR